MHSLSKKWHGISAGTPGRRFRDRYYHAHQSSKRKRNAFHRVVRLSAAAVLLALGVVFAVIPGPAIPLFFLAGALLASDWLWMAKVLDWIELRARRLFRRLTKVWHHLPAYGRVLLIILGAGLSATLTYGTFRLFH